MRKKNQARIQKVAEELGYVVNEAARSLRNVRTMTVGLVFFDLASSMGIDLLRELSSRLAPEGYCVFVATAQSSKERYDSIVRTMLERRVDALLCLNADGKGKEAKDG